MPAGYINRYVDAQTLSKLTDNYKYLLTVIDVFSKSLHIVHLK